MCVCVREYACGVCMKTRERVSVCVCVCVFSSNSFWTSSSLDVPAGVTQDFSSTFFLRCVP